METHRITCPEVEEHSFLQVTVKCRDRASFRDDPFISQGTCPKCKKTWWITIRGELIPRREGSRG
jgi:hypothetical protein